MRSIRTSVTGADASMISSTVPPGWLNGDHTVPRGTAALATIGMTVDALALTSLAIPILMIALSMTLPARVNRTINLVVATLYIPATIYNAAGESWTYSYFYGLSIGLEVLLLVFILRAAWTWPRAAVSSIPDRVDPNRSQIQMGR